MGLRIQLGHSTGCCVNPQSGHEDFVVLHTNGIHRVAVDFCDCEHSMPHRIQLLRADWFPATIHQPQTCCTNRLLEQFHLLTLASKVSGYEFYKLLERMSDNTGLLPIKVCSHRHEFHHSLTVCIASLPSFYAYHPDVPPHQTSQACWSRQHSKWHSHHASRWTGAPLPGMSSTRHQLTKRLEECGPFTIVSDPPMLCAHAKLLLGFCTCSYWRSMETSDSKIDFARVMLTLGCTPGRVISSRMCPIRNTS